MVSVQGTVSVQRISLFFRCHGGLFIYTLFLFSLAFSCFCLFWGFFDLSLPSFDREFAHFFRVESIRNMTLCVSFCVSALSSFNSAQQSKVMQQRCAIPSRRPVSLRLSLLCWYTSRMLSSSSVTLAAAFVSKRHKDRVRLLHEPSFFSTNNNCMSGQETLPRLVTHFHIYSLNNLCCSKSKPCYRWVGNPLILHLFILQ